MELIDRPERLEPALLAALMEVLIKHEEGKK